MARRRKLEAPSAADLNRLEEEFRRETPMKGAMAPIAQVAADAAEQSPVIDTAERERMAKNAADAETLKTALSKGLVMTEVPLGQIDLDDMIRDRVSIDAVELQELKESIQSNGLRLPVELYKLANPADGKIFGVVSGFRRVLAMRDLQSGLDGGKFDVIKALIKPIETMPDAFVAMVEENEVRSQLSHFERGRIAVISTQNGAFGSVEEAVSKLFASASKAKRSKVRSFAHVFEELGDLMRFADHLTEKQGLRLASTLRLGHVQAIREAIARQELGSADEEWLAMLPAIEEAENGPKDASRGGRPRSSKQNSPAKKRLKGLRGESEIAVSCEPDGDGFVLRLEGQGLNARLAEAIKLELEKLLAD